MKRSALVLCLTLLLSVLASAHGNLEHIMGTVTEITDHSLSVKVADGSIKIVAWDTETKFLRGTNAATIKDVLVGSRVVIHAHKNGDKYHAAEVKIGITAPAQH